MSDICFAGYSIGDKVYPHRVLYTYDDSSLNGVLMFNLNWDKVVMSISKLEKLCCEIKDNDKIEPKITVMLSCLYEYLQGMKIEDKSRVLIEKIGLQFVIKKGRIESLSLRVVPEKYTAAPNPFSTYRNEDGTEGAYLPEESYKLFEDTYCGEPIKRDSYYDNYEATYKIYYNLQKAMTVLEFVVNGI